MKKFAAVMLVFALVLSLTACASAEFKSATELVGALAETDITVDSAETVAAARAAYDLLTEDEKAKFELYDVLTAAEADLAEAEAYAVVQADLAAHLAAVLKVRDNLVASYDWIASAWETQNISVGIDNDGESVASITRDILGLTITDLSWAELAGTLLSEMGMDYRMILEMVVLIYDENAMASIEEMPLEELEVVVEPYLARNLEFSTVYETEWEACVETLNNEYTNRVEIYADTEYIAEYDAACALQDAAAAYARAVREDLGTYNSLAAYSAGCDAASARLDDALAAVDAIING